MKREILFRGKRADTGEWVYGHYYERSIGHFIWVVGDITAYEVDPLTIGQYVGLDDRKGVKIFEGDVLSWPIGENSGVVVYEEAGCQFRISGQFNSAHIGLNIGSKGKAVVTGNIHDKIL